VIAKDKPRNALYQKIDLKSSCGLHKRLEEEKGLCVRAGFLQVAKGA